MLNDRMPRGVDDWGPATHCPAPSELDKLEHDCNALAAPTGNASVAVLLVDLEHLKSLHETQDHDIGTRVLELVGKRIQSVLRGDDRVYRLEAGKFAILLGHVNSEHDARAVADRVFGLLGQPYIVRGQMESARASIGVAFASKDVNDTQPLLWRAGVALRRAKSSASHAVQFYDLATEERTTARHALGLDLRKALLMRQLELYYQPQVHIESRTLMGFEALLRWRHPELGWISPVDFIPIAEDTGSIGAIGEWVLRTACEQAARLPEYVTVSVNVSPIQFQTSSLIAAVESALTAAALSPQRLELEITEGVLLQNKDAIESKLNNLRGRGVRVAMDDFGTGYSSLGQLVQFPFDTIKIDRSLVGGNARQRAVVRAIAKLGEDLGLSVLAEGVETAEQLASVCADGCASVQGYVFGKPTPACELESVIARLANPLRIPPVSRS